MDSHLFDNTMGVASADKYVEEYHPVAAASSTTTTPPRGPPRPNPRKRQRPGKQQHGDHESDNEVDLEVAPATTGVLLTINNGGVGLCKGWQIGKCRKCDAMSRRAKDGVSAHQCARCLDNRHGAHWPKECTAKQVTLKPQQKKRRK